MKLFKLKLFKVDTEQDRVILIRTVVQFMATKVSLLTLTIVKLVVSNTWKACALLTLVKLVVTNPWKTWTLWLLCLLLDESGWKYLRCYILPEIRHISISISRHISSWTQRSFTNQTATLSKNCWRWDLEI